jgi:hypothetical protein
LYKIRFGFGEQFAIPIHPQSIPQYNTVDYFEQTEEAASFGLNALK